MYTEPLRNPEHVDWRGIDAHLKEQTIRVIPLFVQR
jgi:hypothetical protein